MSLFRSSLSLLTLFTLAACSSGGPGGSPQNPDAAPTDLPVLEEFDASKAFGSWQKSLFKSCDVATVFGIPRGSARQPVPLIDVELLSKHAQSGRRLQFGEDSLLVRRLVPPSGMAASSYTATTTENGQTRQVKLQVRQSGGFCEVFADDRQLAKVQVIAKVLLFAHVRAGDVSTAFVERNMTFEELPSGFVRSSGESLFPALIDGVEPREEALSRALGISVELTRQMIQFERSVTGWNVQARWSRRGAETLPVFSGRHPEMLMPAHVARELASPEPRPFAIEWIFGEGEGSPFPNANKGSDILMTEISFQPGTSVGKARLRVTQLFEPTTRTFNDSERLACARDRARLYGAARPATAEEAALGPDQLFEPCEAMGSTASLRRSPQALAQVLEPMIGATQPGTEARFKGWDETLSEAILSALDANTDPKVALATKTPVPLVDALVNELRRLDHHAKEDPRIMKHRDPYVAMVSTWARHGDHPDHRMLLRILTATAPLVGELPDSVKQILRVQAHAPGSEDGALRFAEQQGPGYANAARSARLAMEAAGDHQWLQLVYSFLLQQKISQEELERIALSVPRVAAILNETPTLKPFTTEVQRLVLRHPATSDLARIHELTRALGRFAQLFPDSTKAALRAALEDLSLAVGMIGFAESLSPEELPALAQAAQEADSLGLAEARSLLATELLQRRPSADQRKLAIETISALTGFHQAEQRRVPSGLLADSERVSIRRAIAHAWQERWTKETFGRLSLLVEPARASFVRCKDSGSISAVMHCVGLERFSTQHPRLLSPTHGTRYVTLAVNLVKISRRFAGELANAYLAEGLVRDFYRDGTPTWAQCSSEGFDAKVRELIEQVARIGGGLSEDAAATRAIRENQKDCAL